MEAFAIPGPGTPTITHTEAPIPTPGPTEMLVQIHAIGVGIHDSYFLPDHKMYPYPIGIEAAGTVESLGAEVSAHDVGDRIAFVSMMQSKGGTWARYAAVDESSVMLPIPDDMPYTQAAAIPVGGNSALRAIHALGASAETHTLFIAGASGAVGSFAIQIARQRGWQVDASASPANHDYLVELGVELTVDYRDLDWQQQVLARHPGGVDAAIAIQPNTTTDSRGLVVDGGTVVTVSADEVESTRDITVCGLDYGADVRDELVQIMDEVVAGTLRVEIERVYPFAAAADALAKVQTRHARGKIVITLD